MKVLITGANGFIGKNLQLWLHEYPGVDVVTFTRENCFNDLVDLMPGIDFVFHLAGINRPKDVSEFVKGNEDLTKDICSLIGQISKETGKKIPVVFTSSIQADLDNDYGGSKFAAEKALEDLNLEFSIPVYTFRLPNVFGKWCKPNYNSVIATFCHNIVNDLPITINDRSTMLTLVYIDDVITRFLELMNGADSVVDKEGFEVVNPQYTISLGEIADTLESFKKCRKTLLIGEVGVGVIRALYSTYVSYLPENDFKYSLPMHGDERGIFVEMLKTPDSGQFSYFTAHPGVTRGGHYHHTKTEKFLVIKGTACFKFRHMLTDEIIEINVQGSVAEIVETIPGWGHDITNVGDDELVVMLWANENFNRERPDTYSCRV